MATKGEQFVFRFEGVEYPVSAETFANVSREFFLSFHCLRDAQASENHTAQIGPLLWLYWGIMGLIREENPHVGNLDLTLPQVEALGDALYYAAIQRGYKPG